MKITHLPEDGKNFIPYEVSGKTIDFDDGEADVQCLKERA